MNQPRNAFLHAFNEEMHSQLAACRSKSADSDTKIEVLGGHAK